MIFIALGGNLEGPWGNPVATFERALDVLASEGVDVSRRSSWYRSAPFGYLHQPPFVNGVVAVETSLAPLPLLSLCHDIEKQAGRRRAVRWGPRSLDLDLICYNRVIAGQSALGGQNVKGRRPLILPHPGIAERSFVLVPIAEIAPTWRHPLTGRTAHEMLRRLGGTAHSGILGTVRY